MGPDYSYTPGGRLYTRTWARTLNNGPRITTTYSYNPAGDLARVDYSDDTAHVSFTYDRLGRRLTAESADMTITFGYNDANQLTSESYSGGPLDGLSVTNGYDPALRRTGLVLLAGPQPQILHSVAYAHDPAGRLQTVTSGSASATYFYLAHSPLVGQITFSHNGQTVMTTTKQYDRLNRLTRIASVGGTGSTLAAFAYTYNAANQRTRMGLADGSYWVYQYDALGQVISGKKYWPDGTPVAGQQFEYAFDHIGNRTQTKAGGDAAGQGLRQASYSPNLLNQYTQRTVPGAFDVLGIANVAATVKVNNQDAYRRSQYFSKEVTVNNGNNAVWQPVTVTAALGNDSTSTSGHVFVPKTPELFSYDADGNLLSDGRWTYTWDAENRLVKVESRSDTPPASWRRVEWTYDALGRRIRQTTSVWTNNTWAVVEDLKFISDPLLFGRHIAELRASDNALVRTYVWGLDLSGTEQGAGGIGGLVWFTQHTGANVASHSCAYDGNGNEVALVNAANGTETAHYEYGPFGEPLRITGPAATLNPFRFSTKRTCPTTDLVLYEYRVYNPSTGRWPNRDPLGERGGINLYAFVENDGVNWFDDLGLFWRRRGGDGRRRDGNFAGAHRFIWHFYFGGGEAVDIGEWGYLGHYRSAKDVQAFECEARNGARAAVDCCTDGTYTGSYYRVVDGTDGLFVMGRGRLNASWSCTVSDGSGTCAISYRIRDSFRDPLDLGEHFPWLPDWVIEVGGTPYPLLASWNDTFDACSEFEDCSSDDDKDRRRRRRR